MDSLGLESAAGTYVRVYRLTSSSCFFVLHDWDHGRMVIFRKRPKDGESWVADSYQHASRDLAGIVMKRTMLEQYDESMTNHV